MEGIGDYGWILCFTENNPRRVIKNDPFPPIAGLDAACPLTSHRFGSINLCVIDLLLNA